MGGKTVRATLDSRMKIPVAVEINGSVIREEIEPRVSSTIRTFSDAVQRRRRWTDAMISTRSAGLVIDTVVCLTLAKWETVSGRFGGYLTGNLAGPPIRRVPFA
jgi:hypothetical protein